jgi:hypothetical protein
MGSHRSGVNPFVLDSTDILKAAVIIQCFHLPWRKHHNNLRIPFEQLFHRNFYVFAYTNLFRQAVSPGLTYPPLGDFVGRGHTFNIEVQNTGFFLFRNIFAMDAGTSCEANIKVMADAGLPTICLAWGNNTEEFKQSMDLVGKVLNQKALAEEYNKYFDDTIARVNKAVKNVPEEKKPRVLHLNVESMTSPHKITEWWISEAGGNSLTKEVRIGENIEISMEQLLKWDPEVIVVFAPGQVKALYNDSRFKDVSAVKNKRVYATPMGAHIWSTRTSEQP